jgi:hypothetical protein
MLNVEISESKRLKDLYEERLRCLLDRDARLVLVKEGAVHLYDHYEAHFRKKIRENELVVDAATEVLTAWHAEQPEPPPRRPHHKSYIEINDAFMMDFENDVLREWDARKGIPRGTSRYENAEWSELIKLNVYPNHSDVDWDEYVEWVSQGGGDEWFMEE